MTSQGHPRTQFRRALERGNLVMAELTVRECGVLSLDESLSLTALVAQKDRPRSRRMAARWLQLYLENNAVAIDEAAYVAGALAALGGPMHDRALTSLRAMLETATSEPEPTVVRWEPSGERGGSV